MWDWIECFSRMFQVRNSRPRHENYCRNPSGAWLAKLCNGSLLRSCPSRDFRRRIWRERPLCACSDSRWWQALWHAGVVCNAQYSCVPLGCAATCAFRRNCNLQLVTLTHHCRYLIYHDGCLPLLLRYTGMPPIARKIHPKGGKNQVLFIINPA